VVVVDMQNDFVDKDGALPVPGADTIVKEVEQYLHQVTEDNGYCGVLFTFDTHYSDTYDQTKEKLVEGFPAHCLFCRNHPPLPNYLQVLLDGVWL
jgi:nicotinamidase-related amidase